MKEGEFYFLIESNFQINLYCGETADWPHLQISFKVYVLHLGHLKSWLI